MNIGDRIQLLRKLAGISQEELADKVCVSRQAVSKWESGQSTPDIDKIILLSDYFETTTDYLLKGISPPNEKQHTLNAMLFPIVGTMLNAIGLAIALAIWVEKRTAYAAGIGITLMLLGTGIFVIGQFIDNNHKTKANYYFILPNVWFLLPIPLAFCISIITEIIRTIMPVPLLFMQLLYWVIYIAICVTVDIVVIKRLKQSISRSRNDIIQ